MKKNNLIFSNEEIKKLFGNFQRYNFHSFLLQKYPITPLKYPNLKKSDKISEDEIISALKDNECKTNGVYIHIPFCKSLCKFCFFDSIPWAEKDVEDYMKKLYLQFDKFLGKDTKIDSVFFGGGTPLILSAQHLEKILKKIRSLKCSPNLQINIETTPEEINPEKINTLKKYGVNRITIGIQTFDKALLKELSRNQQTSNIKEKFELLRRSGIECINVDLLLGLPNQTMNSFKDDLRKIIDLNPDCIHLNVFTPINSRAFEYLTYEQVNLREKMIRFAKKTLRAEGYKKYLSEGFVKSEDGINKQFQDIVDLNTNIIAIGHRSRGHVFRRYNYVVNYGKEISYSALRLTKDNEMEKYTAFNLGGGINLSNFSSLFSVDFERYYEGILSKLFSLGYLKKKENIISFKIEKNYYINAYKFFIIVQLFWSNEIFKKIYSNEKKFFDFSKKYEKLALKEKIFYDDYFIHAYAYGLF